MNATSTSEKLQFSIEAKALIETLKVVGGVIENTQVIPILSHVKLEISNGYLTAIASDSEIEMTASTVLGSCCDQSFTTAVSCKKLLDICKTLPAQSTIKLTLADGWLCLESDQSKFMLATLSATNFPRLNVEENAFSWRINSSIMHNLLQNTAFSMAEQDVRFFLNGLHISLAKDSIHVAATDGHRLASAEASSGINCEQSYQCIIPRKATITLTRLLQGLEEELIVHQTQNHIQISCPQFSMTSNLLEGNKIDCQQLIPSKQSAKKVEITHSALKQALSRAAILSHEKFRGAKIGFSENCMNIQAHNAEQEKTEEKIPLVYDAEPIEMAFNISYLQDMLSALSDDILAWYFLPEKGTVLVEENHEDRKFVYVVMSMHI